MRKFFSALLLLPLAATLLPITALATPPTFSGGDGTLGDPYQISTCLQLRGIDSYLNQNFILINDIDCSETSGWNGGDGFTQLARSGTAFTGKLNGQGHVIENLYIDAAGKAYSGLFSNIDVGAEIYDLGLINASALGTSSYSGLLVGLMDGGIVTRVYTTGQITAPGASYVGGIVGDMAGGMLVNAYSHATVTSAGYAAGIVGAFDDGTVTNVYATGANSGVAKRGVVTYFGGTITNAFYDSTTTGASDDSGYGKPRSSVQMKSVATYTLTGSAGLTSPWDFVGDPNNDTSDADYWSINSEQNSGYPYLTNVRIAAVYADTTTTTTAASFKTSPIQTKDDKPLTVFINGNEATTAITNQASVNITTNARPETVLEYAVSSNPSFLNTPLKSYKEPISLPAKTEAETYYIRFFSTTNVPSKVFKITVVRAEIITITQEISAQKTEVEKKEVEKIENKTQETTTQPQQTNEQVKKQIFTRDLRYGMRGEDVRALQQFLNRNGFQIVKSGSGSPGNESTYFGTATRTALIKYQEANAETILRPLRLTRGTGLFLGKTRSLVSSQ